MTLCYLGLGSNLGNPQYQLRRAIKQLRQIPQIRLISVATFYPNKAFGRKVQPGFFNTVVSLYSSLTPKALLAICHEIESKQGRQRKIKWGARTLDIDILFYGSKVINTPTLVIPHPELLKRDFVLIPLLEIAPNISWPNGQRIADSF